MSNADLIEQAREAIDNMDDFARMANVVATGPLLVLNSAIDTLELADKRIAELEAERPISHDDWYALCNKYDAAAQKAAELSIRCDEAERKLAVAREAMASTLTMLLDECNTNAALLRAEDALRHALAQTRGE